MFVVCCVNEELNILDSSPNIVRAGDKIEKNVMDGACSAYGKEKKRIQGYGVET